MDFSLGLVEVSALGNAIMMLDEMLKVAEVEFVSVERKLGGRLVTIVVRGSISSVTASPITAIRIANVGITPIVCDSTYPKFYLSLDIRKNDSEEAITTHIYNYLDRFVNTFFTEIPNIGVQSIMNKAVTGYASSCAASAKAPECSNCSANVYSESYIYNNRVYCLNCMYDMVVHESINNNISDLVGLSDQITSSNYAIVDSTEWKRSVIDKYINVMASLGAKPNITHYMMTCY